MARATVPSYLVDREFRLQRRAARLRGSSVDARANEPLWKVLELAARVRAEKHGTDEPARVDARRRAANDLD